jgi:transposase
MSVSPTQNPLEIPSNSAEKDALILKILEENKVLKDQLAYLKRMIFGQKRERFVAAPVPEEQMALEGLFETAGAKIPGFAESKETISYERRKPKKGHGRNAIPDDLHREKHIIEPAESEKICACCGSEKKVIGEDITEELEYKPAVFYVNQFIRPKYVCAKCPDQGITTGQLPARPIDKGIAGAGLLAYILVSKYVDHLPLYRLQQMFMRYNIHINRSTMAGWIAGICVFLEAIYNAMIKDLMSSFLIQADETTLKVLDDTEKGVSPGVKRSGGKCALGYLWPYVGDGKLAVFEFLDSRGREGPTDFLEKFTGRYLLSDGYAGYNEVVAKNKLTHLMCWAHARRKFFEAKDTDPAFAESVLELIKDVYKIELEATAGKLDWQARCTLRNQKTVPVLSQIKSLLENPGKVILPKSKMAEAIAYTLNHWVQLTRFLEDGRLPVDNNLCENTIRPVALGRKNWLFAGSPEGAKRMAIIYSLVATCKLRGINPYEYFVGILPKVATYPDKNIADLSPVNWKMAIH